MKTRRTTPKTDDPLPNDERDKGRFVVRAGRTLTFDEGKIAYAAGEEVNLPLELGNKWTHLVEPVVGESPRRAGTIPGAKTSAVAPPRRKMVARVR